MTSRCNQQNKHPPATAIRFFKIILRKSLGDGNLKIPNNFTRKYGGGLSNPVFLKPPDGTEWRVYWTKHDGGIWFQKGWKEFSRYYSLDHGHLVLFEYEGTSHFEVHIFDHIFDMSALEIDYPFHGTQDEKDNHEEISDDSVEILDELPPCQKTRPKPPMSSPQPRKKLSTDRTRDVERSSNPQNLPQHSEGTNFEMPIISSVKQELDDGKATQRTSRLISPRPRPGTTGTLKGAKKFTSENPFFIINIKQKYLGRTRPNLSTVFLRKYFNKKKQNVRIQFGKKLWPVKLLYYPSKYTCMFAAGWTLFAKESKLQAGDVCIFELINKEDAVLDVHIFRGHS